VRYLEIPDVSILKLDDTNIVNGDGLLIPIRASRTGAKTSEQFYDAISCLIIVQSSLSINSPAPIASLRSPEGHWEFW